MLKLHQTHWKDAFKIEACQQPNKMKTNESQGEAQTDAEVWQILGDMLGLYADWWDANNKKVNR